MHLDVHGRSGVSHENVYKLNGRRQIHLFQANNNYFTVVEYETSCSSADGHSVCVMYITEFLNSLFLN